MTTANKPAITGNTKVPLSFLTTVITVTVVATLWITSQLFGLRSSILKLEMMLSNYQSQLIELRVELESRTDERWRKSQEINLWDTFFTINPELHRMEIK